jgi:2-hydroxychromene-2-carboxylate isomerase
MSDPDVIRKELAAEDLPSAEIMEAVKNPALKADLFKVTDAAVKRGIFGAPTMFVGDEMFFGKDRLREVEEEIMRQIAGAAPIRAT